MVKFTEPRSHKISSKNFNPSMTWPGCGRVKINKVFWGQASNFLIVKSFIPFKNIPIFVPTNDVFTSRENG